MSIRTDPAGVPTPSPTLRPTRPPRAWAWTGVAAGVLGIATIQASMATSVDWEATAGDAEAMLADAATKQGAFLAFHLLACLTMLALPIFGAGLKRRLDQQGPAGALHGQVGLAGLLLTAAALLLGSGLDTQFALGFSEPELFVPESAAFYTDWVATIPWLWVGAGLTALALSAASLRHGAAPRWIGVVSLVLGALTVVAGISPLQYMAGFVGPIWLLVVSLGFALGDRR
ncbi:conserved hypothetical protein [Beutenbergia cavernae DSM 12333]|uniref:Integral membrane protein n=1 Tax=Beutenbergia cavernae (strain ATCC BAA-8 / DSM 12333 / CCUG 43141 / JCM 11478 / NBRC 16432 / NCIMB 13614 / HKI 0122) TaxID=471853 RepID=C5C637_BEUC1|nr:hypothetical protein [Beutenbergia cavernae]ACQ82395.1 conserved hypothetical protein [Beutenbergia cavernae DSM 12333]